MFTQQIVSIHRRVILSNPSWTWPHNISSRSIRRTKELLTVKIRSRFMLKWLWVLSIMFEYLFFLVRFLSKTLLRDLIGIHVEKKSIHNVYELDQISDQIYTRRKNKKSLLIRFALVWGYYYSFFGRFLSIKTLDNSMELCKIC